MNDDIISRLQEVPGGVAEDAIVEITNLKAENARLRKALLEIEYLDRPQVRGLPRRIAIQEIARAALGETQ
jgi:hypothetical protein